MKRLSTEARGVLASGMTDSSAGALLGWSSQRVQHARAELACDGAPDGLDGAALANWLIDNTAATFDQVAIVTGLHINQVRRLADGEDELPVVHINAPGQLKAETAKALGHAAVAAVGASSIRPAKSDAPLSDEDRRLARFVGWFLAAGWRRADVAALFDHAKRAFDADDLDSLIEGAGQ